MTRCNQNSCLIINMGETPRTTVLLEACLIIINLFFILLIDVMRDPAKEDCQEIVSIII